MNPWVDVSPRSGQGPLWEPKIWIFFLLPSWETTPVILDSIIVSRRGVHYLILARSLIHFLQRNRWRNCEVYERSLLADKRVFRLFLRFRGLGMTAIFGVHLNGIAWRVCIGSRWRSVAFLVHDMLEIAWFSHFHKKGNKLKGWIENSFPLASLDACSHWLGDLIDQIPSGIHAASVGFSIVELLMHDFGIKPFLRQL